MFLFSSYKNLVNITWFENKTFKGYVFHLGLITFTWLLGKYITVVPFLNDNTIVNNYFCLLFTIQTILIYYFFSLYVFPRYLYTKKYIPFALYLLVSFLLIYWSNYASIEKLIAYSDGNQTHKLWIQKMWGLLKVFGWFGCFTNPVITFWSYGFSFEFATLYLFLKAFSEILAIQKKNLLLERDNLAVELDFLRAQINPHFLFNTLNSIYTRTIDVDDQASDLVLKLSNLMRYSLYRVNEDKVLLSEELDYIQNYLSLEKYRHSSELVEILYVSEGNIHNKGISPLLLITLVENAFKHGINVSRKRSFVQVSVVIEKEKLYFTVLNSVPENDNSSQLVVTPKKSGGVGLRNIQKRLKLLYPNRFTLNFEHAENEFEVQLIIDLDDF